LLIIVTSSKRWLLPADFTDQPLYLPDTRTHLCPMLVTASSLNTG
jgi:hypothetical protein